MQVGDILEMEPTMEGTSGLGTDGPQRCTVVWIHPDKRFFVVEFRSRITGETWRETVYFPLVPNEPDRCGIGFHQRLDK